MLSICIPVFNFEAGPLVSCLFEQALQLNIPFEVQVWDDGSEALFKEKNSKLGNLDPRIHYVELASNIGRSRVRNQLADAALYDYILFLDCDAAIPDDRFLANYCTALSEKISPVVICGGRTYTPEQPAKEFRLHWKYGINRESQPAFIRRRKPNASFMTNNFVLSKNIFNSIRFNEQLQGYGHEDTLFGWELKKNGISITHIENPVRHIGLEKNKIFLAKTREGITNLFRLYQSLEKEKNWYKDIRLLNYFTKLKAWGLASVFFFLFKKLQKWMLVQLQSEDPSLFLFNAYKLGLLFQEERKNNSLN